MIAPGEFYDRRDIPSPGAKKRMWKKIHSGIRERRRVSWFIADRKSFAYGMAASVIIYFSAVGIYSTARESIRNSQPSVIRLDAAYQSAIEQLENVMPQVVSASAPDEKSANYLSVRKEQLRKLDAAIAELKSGNTGRDISPMLQKRLRQLYSLKLSVLQEMIENGEIEL